MKIILFLSLLGLFWFCLRAMLALIAEHSEKISALILKTTKWPALYLLIGFFMIAQVLRFAAEVVFAFFPFYFFYKIFRFYEGH